MENGVRFSSLIKRQLWSFRRFYIENNLDGGSCAFGLPNDLPDGFGAINNELRERKI